MSRFWTFLTYVHTGAGPLVMLLYPLYASVMAMESPSKVDDEQWLAYWILYSFLTLVEIIIQPVLEWIPIWYTVKLAFIAWLVLPQTRGAAFIYDTFIRKEILKRYGLANHHQTSSCSTSNNNNNNGFGKTKNKIMDFVTPKKAEN